MHPVKAPFLVESVINETVNGVKVDYGYIVESETITSGYKYSDYFKIYK